MKTPNEKLMVLGALGPDDEDEDLRTLITVDLEDEETAHVQAVDEFSDEFLLQAASANTRRPRASGDPC